MLTRLLTIHHCSSDVLKTINLTKDYEQKVQSYNFQVTNYRSQRNLPRNVTLNGYTSIKKYNNPNY